MQESGATIVIERVAIRGTMQMPHVSKVIRLSTSVDTILARAKVQETTAFRILAFPGKVAVPLS